MPVPYGQQHMMMQPQHMTQPYGQMPMQQQQMYAQSGGYPMQQPSPYGLQPQMMQPQVMQPQMMQPQAMQPQSAYGQPPMMGGGMGSPVQQGVYGGQPQPYPGQQQQAAM